MTITIATVNLHGILNDALQTAETDPEASAPGIHMATYREAYGDQPGKTDLLAVTSTDRFVVGHTTIPVAGQIVPSVWPVDAAKTAALICKQLITTHGKEHTVDLEVVEMVPERDVSGDDKAEHPGYVVTLSETPALFKADTEFQFHADHESKFPVEGMRQILTGSTQSETGKYDGPETQWNARVLAPLTIIAKRRKHPMRFFRSPDRRAHLVQIGPYWLGAAMPLTPLPGEEMREPSIEPLLSTK